MEKKFIFFKFHFLDCQFVGLKSRSWNNLLFEVNNKYKINAPQKIYRNPEPFSDLVFPLNLASSKAQLCSNLGMKLEMKCWEDLEQFLTLVTEFYV